MLILRPKDYFTKLLEDDLRAIVKPQYVDQIPKSVRGPNRTVKHLISSRASMDNLEEVCDTLGELHRLGSIPDACSPYDQPC